MMTDEAVQIHTVWKILLTIQLVISTLAWALYRQLPLKVVSRCWGWVSQIELPTYLRPTLIGFYVWLFRCRIDEAAVTNLKEYRSLSDFFRRELKPGVRPIDEGYILTSPCDGRILHVGEVVDGMLEQVKGVTYNLSDFFGPAGSDICRNLAQRLHGEREREHEPSTSLPEDEYMRALMHQCENRLFFCTIYLGPGDYHRFHAPTDWTVHSRRYFPGNLFSVNPSIAKRLRGLFSMNERAVYFGKWRHGFFSFAAVGATNVGSINVYCDQDLVTNRRHTPKTAGNYNYHCYDFTHIDNNNDDVPLDDVYDRDDVLLQKGSGGGVSIEKGEMIGDFNFGSTIVLVFEAPRNFSFSFQPGDRVQYGQGLGAGHIDYCDHIM